MNKYQRFVAIVAIIDLIVIFLFPPFVERSLARNLIPSFDGFYFLLSEFGHRQVDAALLSLELFWIAANTLAAWLLLGKSGLLPDTAAGKAPLYPFGIGAFALTNLAVIALFPPFEQYNSLLRTTAPGFDSFYFVFGDRSARPFFKPLFQIEIFFVLINALALFLLFNALQRGERSLQEALASNAGGASPQRDERQALGRGQDRRQLADPQFRGSERRNGQDRRYPA